MPRRPGFRAASSTQHRGERLLKSRSRRSTLDAFGDFSRAELASMGGLSSYVELTQIGRAPLLAAAARKSAGGPPPHRCRDAGQSRARRAPTRVTALGSLLAAIDRTVSASGARELAARLAAR